MNNIVISLNWGNKSKLRVAEVARICSSRYQEIKQYRHLRSRNLSGIALSFGLILDCKLRGRISTRPVNEN